MDRSTDISEQYVKVSLAARQLRRDTSFVYRAIQRGDLEGLDLGGMVVRRDSIEKLKARLNTDNALAVA